MKINTTHITCIFILLCINSFACLSNEKKERKVKDKLLKKQQTKQKSNTNEQKLLKNTKSFKTDSSKYEDIMEELNDVSNEKDLVKTLKGEKIDQFLEKHNTAQQNKIDNSKQISQYEDQKNENIRLKKTVSNKVENKSEKIEVQKTVQNKLENQSEKIEVKKVEKQNIELIKVENQNTEMKKVSQVENKVNTTEPSTTPKDQQQKNMMIQMQLQRQQQLIAQKRKLEEEQKQQELQEQLSKKKHEKENSGRNVLAKNSSAPCVKNYTSLASPDEDLMLDKETQKQIRDLNILNQLNGDFSSTVLTDHLSEYSQQVLKDQRANNQHYLLSRLRHYEQGSSYSEGPSFIASVQSPVVTMATVPDPQVGDSLWQQRKPNAKFKSVIYKQSSQHMNQLRVGNQIYETTIPEKIVGIRNQLELNPQENEKMEDNYRSLTKLKNPLQKQVFSHEQLQDNRVQVNKVAKQAENSLLFNKLATDLDDLE